MVKELDSAEKFGVLFGETILTSFPNHLASEFRHLNRRVTVVSLMSVLIQIFSRSSYSVRIISTGRRNETDWQDLRRRRNYGSIHSILQQNGISISILSSSFVRNDVLVCMLAGCQEN